MARKRRDFGRDISWERVRAIFGDAGPPAQVWERQFDYCDDKLKLVAAMPYREIAERHLWCYFQDLAWVELQPDLFAYLFPACLMAWHESLLENRRCGGGLADFHFGLRQGRIFEKMLLPWQREAVTDFFRDSFLQRLDAEPVSVEPSKRAHPFRWICRLNSLGKVLPRIDGVWEAWWSIETRGRAFAVLKYCSGLVYFEGENIPFGYPSPHCDGRWGPDLWEHDSFIHSQGWLEGNLDILRRTLTFDYVAGKLNEAAARLAGGERELAQLNSSRAESPNCRYSLRTREQLSSTVGAFERSIAGFAGLATHLRRPLSGPALQPRSRGFPRSGLRPAIAWRVCGAARRMSPQARSRAFSPQGFSRPPRT